MSRPSRRITLLLGCGLAFVALGAGFAMHHRSATHGTALSHRSLTAVLAAPDGPVSAMPPAPVALMSGWRFAPDPNDVGLAGGWAMRPALASTWAPVALPHDFNPVISAASNRGGVGWYAIDFTGPGITSGRSWSVRFESVRRNAEVWLNGVELGTSSDPYTPFSLPAGSLVPGGPNLLVVRVDNLKGRDPLPEDWWNWGGILGPVTLEPLGRISLAGLGVVPQLGCAYRCASLAVQGTLQNNTSATLRADVVLRLSSPTGAVSWIRHRGPLLRPRASLPISFAAPVRGPLSLWSPDHPSLYGLQAQTVLGGRVEQQDSLRTGLRSVQVRHGVLYLNGRRLWLHGAAIHEDVAGRGAALSDGDIDTIVSELRSLGANITRAHYLLSPPLLDALDAAGIMVWAQPPVDHADAVLGSPSGRASALSMLRSTVMGDRSHPSVIVNSVGNELTPAPDSSPGTSAYLQQATALVRRLDPGTPVALDTYCYPGFPAQRVYRGLDVLGISSYFGWYSGLPGHSIANFDQLMPFLQQSHSRYPKQALVVSEFGAEGLFSGPASVKGSYAFQSDYLSRTLQTLARLPFLNGSIYWTLREFAVSPGWRGGASLPTGATTDGIHHKGLIAYNGIEKPAYAVAQQAFAKLPAFVR
jgi:hypothetical protein